MSEEKNRFRTPRGSHGHGGGPAGSLGRPVEKAKDFRGTLRRLLRYLKPQRTALSVVIAFAILGTVFTVLGPKITGNAINQLTDGLVAKAIVDSIDKAQPDLQTALKSYNDAVSSAVQQADTAVEKQFGDTVAQQKEQAYAAAMAQADAAATQQFNAAVAQQKQQAYDAAVKQADAVATQKFNETVAQQKQQAYATAMAQADAAATQQFNVAAAQQKQQAYNQAKAQAEATAKAAVDEIYAAKAPGVPIDQYSTLPGYSDTLNAALEQADKDAVAGVDAMFNSKLADAKAQAETQAKAAVDAQFAAQQSTLDQKLADAKAQADTQAKAMVDSQFAAQKDTLAQKLADAKAQAETQAKAMVDSQFAAQQSTMDQKLADAKSQAETQAKDAVRKAFLDKMGMTDDQFTAFMNLAAEPRIKSTDDYAERAKIAQAFFDGMKKLPKTTLQGNSSIKSSNVKITNISNSDLKRYVGDIRKNGGHIDFSGVGRTLLLLLGVYLLSSLFTFVMQFIMSSVAQTVVYHMRRDVDNKLARLPLRYFDSHTNGEVLSRMTNDIDTISGTLQQSLTQLIQSILQLIGYLVMMLTISPILTLIVMLTLPLYVIVTTLIAKKSQKFYAAQQKYLGEISGHTEEMFTGHRVVKAFGREKASIAAFESYNDELYNAGWKAQFLSGVMFPLMNFISNVGYVLISVVGGIFVTKTWLDIGDITAFIQYSRQFSMPIVQTANIANIIQSTVACAERVFEVLDEEEEQPDKPDAKVPEAPQGNVCFDHVDFRYLEDTPLIEDMNLHIHKGDTIAIVGPTGAGKTTLVNLLMRFYEIQSGSITFDGTDIRDMPRGGLRTLFGMVLQDTWLFSGTIEDNIRYGRENATHDEVVTAARAAHADHFIRSLPEGYRTVLNEEASNISQGQRQLLTIARALLADPAVLILDEATSSVDTRTELLIQHAMSVLMKGRTNFVIAHRLSTIRDAKTILVMNHGRIIEQGNHAELMAQNGFYADLYNSQFTGPSVDTASV